jgi:hypothetical protein
MLSSSSRSRNDEPPESRRRGSPTRPDFLDRMGPCSRPLKLRLRECRALRGSLRGCVVSDVRASVAEGLAAAVTPERVEALVEAALVATKAQWVTVTCPHCKRSKKHEVLVADPQTAARVLSLLADQGFGRAAAVEPVAVSRGKSMLDMSPAERDAYRAELLARLGPLPLSAAGPSPAVVAASSPPKGFD